MSRILYPQPALRMRLQHCKIEICFGLCLTALAMVSAL
jgi:hypothetical protein